MPPSPQHLLFFTPLLFLLLTATSAQTQTNNRRLLQATILPPPPPSPHHHHHTRRAPPIPTPPQSTPAPPTPTPANPQPPVYLPPSAAPPPTPIPSPLPPTSRFTSTSATPTPEGYPFTNYPFFPSASPPPPISSEQPSSDASRTLPANISNLIAPNTEEGTSPRRFPVLQAILLALLSLCLLLLSALLSILLFRRLRRSGRASASSSTAARQDSDGEAEDEGRSLKPPPMPTSSTNPSTEFPYPASSTPSQPTPSNPSHLRPGSPELRPLPPLPHVGPPSGKFFASPVPRDAGANPFSSSSSSSPSRSSPSASSPTLASSPAHIRRPTHSRDPKLRPPSNQSWNPSDDDDGGESYTTDMRKARPLHYERLNPGSLQKDEMIQLYLNSSAARDVCLLGALRCRGIGVVLGALGVSEEQVRDALLEGNAHGLGVETLRRIAQLVLTNEEELKLRYFKDDSPAKLCKFDAFLKTILGVPFAFKRVDAMLYVSNFYLEVNQLRMTYATLEAACHELRSSRLFHKVLEAVLNFGNLMSINTGSPNSHALEPNTLLKIVDVKGADGKAALLQFVVQEIMKPEGHTSLNPSHSWSSACKTNANAETMQYDVDFRKHSLQVISKLAAELTNTKNAASINITSLSRTVWELAAGLEKIHDVLRLNSMMASATESAWRFHETVGTFLRQAEEEILGLQGQESVCLSAVKEMAEYFHGGDSASCDEARMFRVFAGVMEFVSMLDRICREAGEIDGDRMGSTTVSWMAATPAGRMTTP